MVVVAVLAPAFAVIAPRFRSQVVRELRCGPPILDPISGEFGPPARNTTTEDRTIWPTGDPSSEAIQ
jgi:hypothetical protein